MELEINEHTHVIIFIINSNSMRIFIAEATFKLDITKSQHEEYLTQAVVPFAVLPRRVRKTTSRHTPC